MMTTHYDIRCYDPVSGLNVSVHGYDLPDTDAETERHLAEVLADLYAAGDLATDHYYYPDVSHEFDRY